MAPAIAASMNWRRRAGVCRSLAKRAVRLAELDGLITVQRRPRSGRKHLTNIIRIIRAEWLDWLAKGRRKTYAINACNRAKPIFAEARGVQKNPPRSQDLQKQPAAIVWIRPWRKKIGQALVAPDVIFRKTALRAGALQ